MATYGFYLDERKNHMTVVSVHPDSASLERHIEIGGPELEELAPFLALLSAGCRRRSGTAQPASKEPGPVQSGWVGGQCIAFAVTELAWGLM